MLLLLLSFITSSNAYMTHDDVIKEMKEAGHIPQLNHTVFYLPKELVRKSFKKNRLQKMACSRQTYVGPLTSPTPAPTASPSPSPSACPTPTLTPSPTPTPTTIGVDMRKCDSSVKTQHTEWCTAFGMASCIENKLCDKSDLSEHHIWSMYKKYSVEAAAQDVPGNLITTEAMWPELQTLPTYGYLDQAKHKLTQITSIADSDTDSAETIATATITALNRGNPVYTGIAVPTDMASCRATIRPTTTITSGGHSVAIVGYELDDTHGLSGGYYIIKGSWGTDCGDNGYQYMPFSVCGLNGMYCYFYEVTSVQ